MFQSFGELILFTIINNMRASLDQDQEGLPIRGAGDIAGVARVPVRLLPSPGHYEQGDRRVPVLPATVPPSSGQARLPGTRKYLTVTIYLLYNSQYNITRNQSKLNILIIVYSYVIV